MQDRLAFALEVARQAGDSTLALFHGPKRYEVKGDGSPVTEADKAAEALIRKAIREHYPGEGILGEEEGEQGDPSLRWVIDPIDGTKSFICGVPLYAALLSCEIEGEPQVGVAYFPALGWMVHAQKGAGAFSNGQPISVSDCRDIGQAVICCGSHRTFAKTGRTEGIQSLAARCLATRTWCDAYGHCLTAAGKVEAMLDPVVAPHDISAVRLIVEEAGGKFTSFSGERGPQSEAISSNVHLHAAILGAFSPQ